MQAGGRTAGSRADRSDPDGDFDPDFDPNPDFDFDPDFDVDVDLDLDPDLDPDPDRVQSSCALGWHEDLRD